MKLHKSPTQLLHILLRSILKNVSPVANLSEMAIHPFDHGGVGVPKLF
jgi:hypothetical protein